MSAQCKYPNVSFIKEGKPVFSISSKTPEYFFWGVNNKTLGHTQEEVGRCLETELDLMSMDQRDDFWTGYDSGESTITQFLEQPDVKEVTLVHENTFQCETCLIVPKHNKHNELYYELIGNSYFKLSATSVVGVEILVEKLNRVVLRDIHRNSDIRYMELARKSGHIFTLRNEIDKGFLMYFVQYGYYPEVWFAE